MINFSDDYGKTVTLADGKSYKLCGLVWWFNVAAARYEGKNFVVRTVCECQCEDWKTVIARNIQPIPAGTELIVDRVADNYYGRFVVVVYNDYPYYLNPRNLEYVGETKW